MPKKKMDNTTPNVTFIASPFVIGSLSELCPCHALHFALARSSEARAVLTGKPQFPVFHWILNSRIFASCVPPRFGTPTKNRLRSGTSRPVFAITAVSGLPINVYLSGESSS